MEGSDTIVKMRHPWMDLKEKITIYANGEEVEAEKRGDLEYRIKGLDNGSYRINAYLVKVGLVVWSNTVEFTLGEKRAEDKE